MSSSNRPDLSRLRQLSIHQFFLLLVLIVLLALRPEQQRTHAQQTTQSDAQHSAEIGRVPRAAHVHLDGRQFRRAEADFVGQTFHVERRAYAQYV